jgi:hypothetical protein
MPNANRSILLLDSVPNLEIWFLGAIHDESEPVLGLPIVCLWHHLVYCLSTFIISTTGAYTLEVKIYLNALMIAADGAGATGDQCATDKARDMADE